MRYGGLRDFILGVRYVDALGRLIRMGGKVVKNAAGFDLPKFFVGSLGRFGILAEVTFKVFPRATDFVTVRLPYAKAASAVEMISTISSSRWEIDALEVAPQQSAIFARIGGPAPAPQALATEILARFPEGAVLEADDAERFWREIREFAWAYPDGVLVKIPLTPKLVPEFADLLASFEGARGHVSGGGAAGYLSFSSATAPELHELLTQRRLRGMTLRGDAPLWPGSHPRPQIEAAVKSALDPCGRFPSLHS
jgi:glycolate oxidase FAD binding subunit